MRNPHLRALLTLTLPFAVLACGGEPQSDMDAAAASEEMAPQQDAAEAMEATSFQAMLSGDNEVPPVATAATGTFTVSIEGDQLTYTLEVNGLSGAARAAHIHGAAPGENGGVIVPLQLVEGAGDSGVIAQGTATVDAAALEAIRAGNAYVNVHTPDNGGGEIRGQLQVTGG